MRAPTAFLASIFAITTLALAGCTPKPGPTAEDGAAHLGLVSGTTFTYGVADGVTETHEVKTSGVLFDGVAVDVLAKQNGFATDDRTLSFGVDVAQVSIVRFFDCIARCGTLSQPIPFLNWPLNDGDFVEGEADVTVTAGGDSVIRTERHTTSVATAPAPVVVPAGTFEDAFLVSWTRTTKNADESEESEITLLHWVPDVGVVRQQAPDGTTLQLSAQP